MSRLSCAQKSPCPDFRALKSPHVQTFVRSKVPMSRLSCAQKSPCPDFRAFKIAYVLTFVRSKGKFVRFKIDNLCVHVQTIVRSKLHMSRLSRVHFFPDRVILNARRHLVRSFRSGHIDFRSGTTTWVPFCGNYFFLN